MKSLLFKFLVFAALLFSYNSFAQIFFSDNFETGTLQSHWTVLSGPFSRTFNNSGSPEGTFHLVQSGTGAHQTGIMADFAPCTPTSLSYWAKSQGGGADTYLVIGDNNTSSNAGIAFIYFSNGVIRFYNGPVNYEFPFIANTWYQIELKNMNFITKTFDIWINGVQRQTGYAFRSTSSTNVSQIHLYNFASSPGAYDDIILGTLTCLNPENGGEIAADQTICSGDFPASFTSNSAPTGFTGDLEYQWQISTASPTFVDISGAVLATYTYVGTVTQTTWFRRLAKVTCETEWVESNVVQVDVNSRPANPTVATPITVCEGDDVIISATGSGTGDLVFLDNTLTEYARITMGGDPTQTYNAGALMAGAYTFYATEDDGTCSSYPVAIDVTVNPLPSAPTAAGTTICEGESAVLTAVASGTANWYSDVALTNLLATGSEYNTGALTATTDYFVTQTNAVGCESAAISVTVTVDPLPIATLSSVIDDFEDGLPAGIDGDGMLVGFLTWGDNGTTVTITTTSVPDPDPLALPGQSGD
ncbi:MAG: hypothetical protein IH598_01285, partial [Bacteroidales bacterium]|nr:hypothetical protein [Bacteroidales bacterium]